MAPVSTDDGMTWGTDFDSFVDVVCEYDSNVYFHNLKFDGGFILDWLLNNGYVFRPDTRKLREKEFTAIISDQNKFYSITIRWETGYLTEFRDSLKKLPMSVDRIAKTFKLPFQKGELDYHKPRPVGYEPDEQELDYLERDVIIVAMALRQVFASGMTRLTVASDSLAEYKKLNSRHWFDRTFPVLSDEMDAEIRRAYRGGFTYVADRFKDKRLGKGLVLDVNSLYPAIMYNKVLPYGEPRFSQGYVKPTTEFPLTIFSVTFTAKLKKDHVPCIQLKGSSIFGGTEYLSEIEKPETLMVTNVDWDLYLDHYDIDVLSYNGGWRFRGVRGLFDNYIDKWMKVKAESKGGAREIAKLHLNSLYGKFASNPNITGKVPTLVDGAVKLVRGKDRRKDPVYTAVGVFVTSYARDLTIRAAQANYDTFVYADTDSLHLLLDEPPESIEIHESKLGAWKLEYNFTEAHYIGAKRYLDRINPDKHCHPDCDADHEHQYEYKTAFAGIGPKAQHHLTFENIMGDVVVIPEAKKDHIVVPGGVVLIDRDYTFKRAA